MSNAQRTSAARRRDWKTSGWQGISAETPADWNLVGYGGDTRAGNVRLDSGSAASDALGLEVRWSQPKGAFTQSELERRLEPFFATIIKTARKGKQLARTESHSHVDPRLPERSAQRAFAWQADRKGTGRIWHCSDCGRLCIAQVVGQLGRDSATTAQDVLATVRCHSPEVGWRTWALYDTTTQVPADYHLHGQPQLMNVYIQMIFQNGQSLDSLHVEQWSMAGAQIRGAYLDEWYRRKNAALEATLRYESRETEAQGHPALSLIGRRAGIRYWAGRVPSHLVKLQHPASHFAAALWECPESNKITLLQSFSRRPQQDLLNEVVQRTLCHSGPPYK